MAKENKNQNGRATPRASSLKVVRKSVSQTRKDIREWKMALRVAQQERDPKQYLLQDIYGEIANDALLSSQVNNRVEQSASAMFEMVTPDNKVDEKATAALKEIACFGDILKFIFESELYGHSLIELGEKEGQKSVTLINRRNVVPDFGRCYPDTSMDNFIEYRKISEFGKWILEFDSGHLGLLNKTVPHLLFKKFAQSCWSELCEIYGIPPRYIKTNTQDSSMLDRAEKMMQDIGAAAWFIIDTTEEFEFAQGVNTNGDVYSNLIKLCNNEVSLLLSGAIIGQDTENGNYSKEKANIAILDRLVDADRRMIENYVNSLVLPAFVRIGWLPVTLSKFRFANIEDTDKLWIIVKELLPHKEVSNEFILEKFGIEVTNKFAEQQPKGDKLSAFLEKLTGGDPDFFA
ncbi:MAG: DUF935 domain-containing protein [Prevotellaceae bacterium]|jgi:hypothetical protein|nr:DUF935 domain-containing protein [Prevotellaceae bacterium]